MNFVDRLDSAIEKSGSVLVAGIDPRIDDLPGFVLSAAAERHAALFERIEYGLTLYLERVVSLLQGRVAAIKPNLAFFEQYGVAGVRAFDSLLRQARAAKLLIIADAKRGDIGSTAQAYSNAFLGRVQAFGESSPVFDADALTVNPFLGFDTVEEFIKDCERYGKGLFVLARTSNPGAKDLQAHRRLVSGDAVPSCDTAQGNAPDEGRSVSESVAQFIASRSSSLLGSSGLSGLGAVVGATYPAEAEALRSLMPRSYFLIPGFGAQGGSAADAMAGFTRESPRRGGLVNASRGIFALPNSATISPTDFDRLIVERITASNALLNTARYESPAANSVATPATMTGRP